MRDVPRSDPPRPGSKGLTRLLIVVEWGGSFAYASRNGKCPDDTAFSGETLSEQPLSRARHAGRPGRPATTDWGRSACAGADPVRKEAPPTASSPAATPRASAARRTPNRLR